jgi:hypothetical protein
MKTDTPRTDERKASFALDTIRQLETELAAVTKQRDRLADQLDDAVAEATNAVNDIIGMKWQRNRLAEALQKLADCDWVISLPDRMDAVRSIAREALQSLTPNEL